MGLLLLGGCADPAARHEAQTEQLLAHLAAPEAAKRDSARAALTDYFFVAADLPLLYPALHLPYPDDSLGSATRLALLDIIAGLPAGEHATQLAQLFEASPALPQVQTRVLTVLGRLGTPEALDALLRLIRATPPDAGLDWQQALAPLVDQPAALRALFPEEMALLAQPDRAAALIHLLAEGLGRGYLAPAALAPHGDALLAYRPPAADLRQAHRASADYLRVAAHLGRDARFNHLLQQALTTGPPDERMAALAACLEVGVPVGDSVIQVLGADVRTRIPLYQLLAQAGQGRRFPAAYAAQAPMAAGDLGLWLYRRGYLKGEPEPVGQFALADAQGWLYAFRFQHQGRWALGLSGPQPADTSRFETGGYLTGSSFKAYVPYRLRRDVAHYLAEHEAAYLLPD